MNRTLILAAAIALVVAGCGTDADEAFKRDFNQTQQPLQQLLTDVSSAPDPSDPAGYAAKMDKLAAGLENSATSLGKLEAPADAKDEFATFVEEVDASADAVRDVEQSVSKPERLAKALTGLQQQMSRVVTAEQALKTAVDG